MRKLIAVAAALGLIASLGASPAVAGKKPVKVHESFGAQLAPFPKDDRWAEAGFTKPGCTSGEEGIHWVAKEFVAPGSGTLRFWMEGFQGDHDIYAFETETVFQRGDAVQVGTDLAPPEEEIVLKVKKGKKLTLVACNWAGEVDVQAHYEGTFK